MTSTSTCIECSHPYAITLATGYGAAAHNAIVLAELECVSCGECPVGRCGWCHELTVDEHEDCASAAAEVERHERELREDHA